MRRARFIVVCALAAAAVTAGAQDTVPSDTVPSDTVPSDTVPSDTVPSDTARPDPFAAIADADPMELARVVDRLGDDAVTARLRDGTPYPARLAAVRATPHMTGPELALAPLAALAGGRHPYLAPAAADSALRIARRLDAQALARREVRPESLTDAALRFDALADDETARADLRVAASIVAAQLSAAGVPASGE